MAETVAQEARILGAVPLPMTLCSHADVAAVLAADAIEHQCKKAFVHQLTVNGQPCFQLIRVHLANGRLWVDVVSEDTLAHLVTRVEAMDLSSVAVGHPAPLNDLADDSALVVAAG